MGTDRRRKSVVAAARTVAAKVAKAIKRKSTRRRTSAPSGDPPGRDYVAIAERYERDVIARRIPACKMVRLACSRNARDRKRAGATSFPYYFDGDAARVICEGAEQFPHIKGPLAKKICHEHADDRCRTCHPKAFHWRTIVLEPWMIWSLCVSFGWKRLVDGFRRFQTVLISVPRKNAKSTIAAIIALLMLTADGEMGAEVYSVATKKDQARIVFDVSRAMARRSPDFREFFGVRVGRHALVVEGSESAFLPLASDADSLDGLNIHFVVIDELHAHKTRALFDVIETSTGARSQPMMFIITTAGVNTAGICYEQLTYLRQILEGIAKDETYFGVEYTIDPEDLDKWDTEAVFRKANPNYGISVRPEDLARLAAKARVSPSAKNNFLTKRLNVWVKADSPGVSMEEWRACEDRELRLEDYIGRRCYQSIDLAEVRDVAAKILLFPEVDGRFTVFGKYYVPEKAVDASPTALYPGWVETGALTQTDGNVIDFGLIEEDIVGATETYDVTEVCFDRALASRMMQVLQKRLLDKPPIVVVPQDWPTMSAAWDTLETLILNQKIRHNGDPVLAWMVTNIVLKPNDRGEHYPVKSGGKDSHNKIDGAIALLIALARAMSPQEEEEDGPSIYETRGLHSVGGRAKDDNLNAETPQ